MTVPSPLPASGAFPGGLHSLYQCRPVDRGKRENKGGQNLTVAFGLILNKKEQRAMMSPGPHAHPPPHCLPAAAGFQGLSLGSS